LRGGRDENCEKFSQNRKFPQLKFESGTYQYMILQSFMSVGDSLHEYYAGHCPLSEAYLIYMMVSILA
jgi:hypothetical protein